MPVSSSMSALVMVLTATGTALRAAAAAGGFAPHRRRPLLRSASSAHARRRSADRSASAAPSFALGASPADGIRSLSLLLVSASASSSSMSAPSKRTPSSSPFVPRAAVSTVVQCRVLDLTTRGRDHSNHKASHDDSSNIYSGDSCIYHNYYLLVQRGKEPNKGMWSLPGGKLEMGEPALVGAQRELEEETAGWTEASIDLGRDIRWYPGTVYATDSIGDGYHYLIAQCFARLVLDSSSSTDRRRPPALQAADDAAAIGWFTRDEVHKLDREATSGVLQVIDRVEELDEKGLLPTG